MVMYWAVKHPKTQHLAEEKKFEASPVCNTRMYFEIPIE